ncbi:unnamed protein product [Schistosoma turkestanicum]|nr:unnamed protein product [Schistosoma turkestanicum]
MYADDQSSSGENYIDHSGSFINYSIFIISHIDRLKPITLVSDCHFEKKTIFFLLFRFEEVTEEKSIEDLIEETIGKLNELGKKIRKSMIQLKVNRGRINGMIQLHQKKNRIDSYTHCVSKMYEFKKETGLLGDYNFNKSNTLLACFRQKNNAKKVDNSLHNTFIEEKISHVRNYSVHFYYLPMK